MNDYILRNLLYWSYGVLAALFFSVSFIDIAVYQHDIDQDSIKYINAALRLISLLSGLFLASLVPVVQLKKLLPLSLLSTGIVSIVAFIYPHAVSLWLLYLIIGINFSFSRLFFVYELSLKNTQEPGLLSDLCHLEAAYMGGVAGVSVLSGFAMLFPLLELRYLFLLTGTILVILSYYLIRWKVPYAERPSAANASFSLRMFFGSPLKVFGMLRHTLVLLFISATLMMAIISGFVFGWVNYYNKIFLQLSDNLIWQFSIILFASIISSRVINAALLHYIPIMNVLIGNILLSIASLMLFTYTMIYFQPTSTIETMADLPLPMLLILVFAFATGSILPILTGIAVFNCTAEQRGYLLGLITIAIVAGGVVGGFMFSLFNKLLNPTLLFGGMLIPLVLLLMLSVLFIKDLRKSTSATTE